MTAAETACSVPRMQVVHVAPRMPERASGAVSVDMMYTQQAAGWREKGFDVRPLPRSSADEHPVNQRCPYCSTDGVE